MRSVSGAMNSGLKMGYALGGLGRNQEAAQNGQAYFEKLRGKFVENAVGVKRNKMGDLEAPAWQTPPEAEYAKAQYLKIEEAGYQKSLQTAIQMSTLRTNIIKQFKDNIDTEGINPETQRGLTANLEKSYVELLGQETYRKLGIDLQERLSLVQTAQEATKIHDTFLLNGLSNAYLEYTANPTTDNLRKYTTLYAENPKKFKDLDFANPQKLFESLKTTENHKVMMARKAEEGGQTKTVTDDPRLGKGSVANVDENNNITQVIKSGEEGDKESAKEEQISRMMDSIQGLSKEQAVKIADGVLKVQMDPVSKEISLVDLSSNSVIKLDTGEEEEKPPVNKTKDKKTTIWDVAGKSTGTMSSIKQGLSTVSGLVGGPIAEDVVRARQFVLTEQNNMVRSLSVNDKYPVGEMKRLREEIQIAPDFFTSPEMLHQKLIAIEDSLNMRLENEYKIMNNKKADPERRRSARQAIREISNFITVMGVPDESERNVGPKQVKNTEDYKKIESGERYIDPKGIPRVKP